MINFPAQSKLAKKDGSIRYLCMDHMKEEKEAGDVEKPLLDDYEISCQKCTEDRAVS